ncbi:MAG: PSD1 and planctomycete cytochrome C domain-containing protein [Planctomycetota bacterium]|nr:PSD1 and planctomycete cytochrome C domain-containing protein [Planctomycetota bacterium]
MIPVPARLLVGGLLITAALGAGGGPDVDPEPAPERPAGAPDARRYGRDIRPILSDRCFLCHGPDRETQRAGLRLDTRAEAVADRDGFAAIVPGDPEASLLYQRITSTDPDDQMPPPESGKHSLTPDQVRLVRTWIEQGAVYESHWAFEAPVRPRTPEVSDPEWCTNDIDAFLLAGMDDAGLRPNPPAAPDTLVRRVYLDLTGLPPTPAERAAFLADPSDAAYRRLVDRLLTEEPYRTRHAERMATPWMDQARFADTSGIHMDAGRSIWLWRDWVLEAYRANKPYDEFVVEQLAGDLMPEPTVEQRIASGFNRNHVTTDEGGAIDAEYLLEYAVDRVHTTSTVFLGLSVGCARCHDHKFDPVSIEEFYSLLAFFNNNEEPGLYSQVPDPTRALEPELVVPDPATRATLERLDGRLTSLETERSNPSPEELRQVEDYLAGLRADRSWSWYLPEPTSATSREGTVLEVQPDRSVLATGEVPAFDEHVLVYATDQVGLRTVLLEALADPSLPNGRVGRAGNGNAVLGSISVEVVSRLDPERRTTLDWSWAWADVEQPEDDFRVTNALRPDNQRVWAVDAHRQGGDRNAVFVATEPFGYEGGSEVIVRLAYQSPYPQHEFGRTRVRLGHVSEEALARLPAATTNWYIAGPFPTDDGPTAYDTRFGPEDPGPLDFTRSFGDQPLQSWRHAPLVLEATPVGLAQVVGAEYLAREVYAPTARTLDLSLGSDDGLQVYRNGELVHEHRIDRGVAPDQDSVRVELVPGRNTLVFKVVNTAVGAGFYHRELASEDHQPAEAIAILLPPDTVGDGVRDRARDAVRRQVSPRYRALSGELESTRTRRAEVAASVPRTMVMQERATPRETHVMMRGQYDAPDLDRPVSRGIPAVLGAVRGGPDQRVDRLDLAEWLVGEENPLTARVTVNRYWALFFGRGIVETTGDFGLQGAWPSHPGLLDWLAVEFRENGWDVRELLRTIVTSSAYRQSSRRTPEARAIDERNVLLGAFPRQRLSAEQIRDQALHASGLLVERLGGPSVKPYQPEGLWQEVAMPQSNTRTFERSDGEGLWRRSLYTYWKRAAPPPSMLTFDAPTREYCVTERGSTNTPLQALVLWNDEQFVEAARVLAQRAIAEAGDDRGTIRRLALHSTGGELSEDTTLRMLEAVAAYRARYRAAPEDARALLSVGEAPLPDGHDPPELASWTMIANALLSSDAAIVKD